MKKYVNIRTSYGHRADRTFYIHTHGGKGYDTLSLKDATMEETTEFIDKHMDSLGYVRSGDWLFITRKVGTQANYVPKS